MSVLQINQWTCDICGAVAETREPTSAYSDPVVQPPQGWDTYFIVPPEFRIAANVDCVDACPSCVAAPNWRLYQARMKFPQSVLDKLGRQPRVGDWYVPCCLEDVTSVTPDLLLDLPELIEEGGGEILPTLDAVLAIYVPDLQKAGQHTQAEIDAIVAKLKAQESKA